MPESYENKTSEQIWKNIDNLDRDINDLDNKVQEREDFTKYFQDIQDIQNKFKLLDNDIDSITDEEVKKNLKDRLNSLKIKMLDLISDWSINDFINWETKDIAINKMVGQVNEIFYNEIENLVKSLDFWNWMINEILSDATSITGAELMEILQILNFPYWSLSIEWQPYLCFEYPQTWETYALVDWKLRICEKILEENGWWSSWEIQDSKKKNSKRSISSSKKQTKASVDNLLQEKVTEKLSYEVLNNKWNKISAFASFDTEWYWATPRAWFTYKWLDAKLFDDIGLNSQLTASYSPWSITWAENWWVKRKDVFKLKVWETFKFKNWISLSLYETFKTSDFSKIKSSNLSTELRASRKPKSNISLSAIANFDYKGNPSFVWLWGSIRL